MAQEVEVQRVQQWEYAILERLQDQWLFLFGNEERLMGQDHTLLEALGQLGQEGWKPATVLDFFQDYPKSLIHPYRLLLERPIVEKNEE